MLDSRCRYNNCHWIKNTDLVIIIMQCRKRASKWSGVLIHIHKWYKIRIHMSMQWWWQYCTKVQWWWCTTAYDDLQWHMATSDGVNKCWEETCTITDSWHYPETPNLDIKYIVWQYYNTCSHGLTLACVQERGILILLL